MTNEAYPLMTVGTVVDTNDPQQMGRLRVNCPKWGDTPDTLVTDMAWASYVAPFGGILTRGNRGPENATTGGPVAYGMFAIPKVGSLVVCILIDGNPSTRAWIGSIHMDHHMLHTLPMGRYLDGGETGPVSSTEQPIEPLSTNMNEAFGAATGNHERLTRGAEGQAASISNTMVDKVVSSRADERNGIFDRQGYQHTRIAPEVGFGGDGSYDPQVYSITSPGLHSFIMDDSLKNGKIRIRSTSGNQIILDDTNERIYISSAEGKNWIEMDQAGNVDIHSDRRVSMHATKGFNFTTEGEFRVSANSIHLRSNDDIRMHSSAGHIAARAKLNVALRAEADVNIQSDAHISMYAGTNLDIETVTYFNTSVGTDYNLSTGATLHMESVTSFSVDAGSTLNLESSSDMDFLSGGDINQDGTEIHLNDALATNAKAVTAAAPETTVTDLLYAYLTSRVPIHEPWGRISNDSSQTDKDASVNVISLVFNMSKDSAVLEIPYSSAAANSTDLGDDLGRNDNWRR